MVRVRVDLQKDAHPSPASRHSEQCPERDGHRFKPTTHVLNTGLSCGRGMDETRAGQPAPEVGLERSLADER